MNQRGEVLTVFLIAFVVFVALMAVGIGVEQTVHPPCDSGVPPCLEKGGDRMNTDPKEPKDPVPPPGR